MEFYSIDDLQKVANKKINVLTINSRTKRIWLTLKYRRLKRELEEVEKAIIWEVLKNGR